MSETDAGHTNGRHELNIGFYTILAELVKTISTKNWRTVYDSYTAVESG